MAFTDPRPDDHRVAKIFAVAAFQAAMGYALVTGLAVHLIKTDPPIFQTRNYPFGPPPPPDPKPTATPEVIKLVPPKPLPVPDIQPLDTLRIDPIPLPIPSDKPLFQPLPKPDPVPKFTPQLASPRNSPGLWVTTNDYPARDIREGHEGTVRFQLSIDARGRVQNCEIVHSSGYPGLDDATCSNVSHRAHFEPASDSSGDRVAGTWSGTVRWVIPED